MAEAATMSTRWNWDKEEVKALMLKKIRGKKCTRGEQQAPSSPQRAQEEGGRRRTFVEAEAKVFFPNIRNNVDRKVRS